MKRERSGFSSTLFKSYSEIFVEKKDEQQMHTRSGFLFAREGSYEHGETVGDSAGSLESSLMGNESIDQSRFSEESKLTSRFFIEKNEGTNEQTKFIEKFIIIKENESMETAEHLEPVEHSVIQGEPIGIKVYEQTDPSKEYKLSDEKGEDMEAKMEKSTSPTERLEPTAQLKSIEVLAKNELKIQLEPLHQDFIGGKAEAKLHIESLKTEEKKSPKSEWYEQNEQPKKIQPMDILYSTSSIQENMGSTEEYDRAM